MSRSELVNAYLSGSISRWTFVRGLMALGVSGVMAASYAVALKPSASAGHGHDFYDFYDDPRPKKKKKKKKGKKGRRKNRR